MTDQNRWDETVQLIDLACTDSIAEEHIEKLQKILLEDSEAKEYYLAYFRLHSELQVAVSVDRALMAVQDKIRNQDQQQIITIFSEKNISEENTISPQLGFLTNAVYQAREFFRQPAILSICIAMFVLLNTFLVLSLINTDISHREAGFAKNLQSQDPENIKVAAWVLREVDAVWDGKHQARSRSGKLLPGDRLALKQGLVEILFANGAEVILQGPVQFEVEAKNSCRLSEGQLTALVPPKAKGFIVNSPTSRSVDLGTEFGVQVQANGSTMIRVFQGLVEAFPILPDGSFSEETKQVITTGKSLWIRASGGNSAPQPDAIQFVRATEFSAINSYHRWQKYQEKLRQDPSLVAYYTFNKEDQKNGHLTNLSTATTGKLAGILGDAKNEKTKPTWVTGRWSKKAALRFDRDQQQRVVISHHRLLDLSGELTLATWVKCAESEVGGVIAGKRQAVEKTIYRLAMLNNRSHPNENCSNFQMQFISSQGVTVTNNAQTVGVNRWRHLAITVDEYEIKFYVNGRFVESRPCSKCNFLTPGNFYIGGSEMTKSHFDGIIDEVVLLSRKLSENELGKMYFAGKPSSK